jgi:hypothetical protein
MLNYQRGNILTSCEADQIFYAINIGVDLRIYW